MSVFSITAFDIWDHSFETKLISLYANLIYKLYFKFVNNECNP
jgi:hypothetical protein